MRRLTALGATLLVMVALGGAALAQGLADVRLGNEAFRQGDYAAAVRHYTDAIRSGELVGEALAITYNNRGVAHGEAGDFDSAIADYSQAMALRPGDATTVRNLRVAHVRRGELRFASGTYDEAVADFTRAIDLEPEHHLAYQRRGELYTELGLIDLAIGDLERAMLLGPGDAEIASALERATAQRDRLASLSAPTGVAPGGQAAESAAAPVALPTPAQTPTAALETETPSPAESTPAEAAAAVAAAPTAAPRETTAAPAPAATAERVIDMSPVVRSAPAASAPPAAAAPAPATVPAPAAAQTTTAAVEGQPFRVRSAVNYRAGPDNSAERLGTVQGGRIVRVIGDTRGWKHVVLPNGQRGYIYGSWLEPAGN